MPGRIKTIIVDDEKIAREEIYILTKNYQEIEIVGEANSVATATQMIQKHKPDLVFLDIQLRGESGFDVLKSVKGNFHVVFVTAYDDYAIRAFEVNALDYLLKPVNPKRLDITIQRIISSTNDVTDRKINLNYEDRVLVNEADTYQFIELKLIKAICAEGNYSRMILDTNKETLILKSLKMWEEQLPEKYFIRIHRSTLVNINYIEKVEKWFSNTCRVFIKGISEPYMMSQRSTLIFKKLYSM